MGLSAFLDITVGLVLMYLILSLICTIVQELITTALSLRAKTLARTMKTLIDDPDIRAAFYNHGLITNAAQASRAGAGEPVSAGQIYVPAEPKHPSYFDPRTVALALLDSLDRSNREDPGQQLDFPTFSQIKSSVSALPDSNIRDVLLSSLAAANEDLSKVRDGVEAWFDSAMDRLSGGYKRRSKQIALWVGIIVAVLLNADSYHVGQALWKDETLRGQAVTAASQFIDGHASADVPECPQTDSAERAKCLAQQLNEQTDALRPFPIGWTTEAWKQWTDAWNANRLFWLAPNLLGLLWTGLALSLGAPFWFDLLQKFMNIRGAKPAPSEKK